MHIALRMKIWNIGSEGQFFMGAWAAAGIGIHWGGPRYVVLLVMAVVAAVAGAVWILVPALARAHWQVNEIITTLLLNFVAIQWVAWFSFDIWRDKAAAVVQSTPVVQARLPFFPGSNTLYVGVFVPLIIAAVTFAVFRYTRWGYEIDMIGGNPRAAEFAGIRVTRRIVIVMLLSGAIAGVSGMLHLAGPAQRLNSSISNNYGLVGIHRRRPRRQLGGRRSSPARSSSPPRSTPGSRCSPTGCRSTSWLRSTDWCCSASPSVRSPPASVSCARTASRSSQCR